MEKLQLLLAGDKGTTTDLSVYTSESNDGLFVYLGLARLERVHADPRALNRKMLVGRLVNGGFGLRELERTFGHEHRTMRRWAQALLSTDAHAVARAFAGQGAMPKVTAQIRVYVRARRRELQGRTRKFRRQIVLEVKEFFETDLSGESLRRLFRAQDKGGEAGGGGPDKGAEEKQLDAPATAGQPETLPTTTDQKAGPSPLCPPSTAVVPAPAAGSEPPRTDSAAGPVSGSRCGDNGCASEAFSCLAADGSRNHSPTPGPENAAGPEASPAAAPAPLPTLPAPPPATPAPTQAPTGPEPNAGQQQPAPRPAVAVAAAPPVPPDAVAGVATPNTPRSGMTGGMAGSRGSPPVLPGSGKAPPSHPRLVHHAGQVLFSPWLDLVGFDRPEELAMQAQWLGQILQGAVNIEQSKTICPEGLAWFTGPVRPGLDTQRTELKRQAQDPDRALAVLAANARLLALGPGAGQVFYYDPHTKQYTGELKVLKGWCGRRHSVEKVLHEDFIHTQHGDPCFVQYFDNFYDLRERVFITLRRFDLLFPEPLRQGRVFVLDRGIFGHDTFELFRARHDHLLTWEKGYAHDGWDPTLPATVFLFTRERNCAGDIRDWRFECQEAPWPKDPELRRIVVRAWNPNRRQVEVSILTTAPHCLLSTRDAVRFMFNRWLQENDFRYLDTHFGIMQATSYDSKSYAEIQGELHDRPVECREYLQTRDQRLARDAALAKLLLHREKLADAQAACQRQLQRHARATANGDRAARRHRQLRDRLARLAASQSTVATQIDQAKQDVAALQAKLDTMLRDQSRLDQLIAENYRRSDTHAKELMDALKITARNVFRRALDVFRPIYDNYRDDHAVLRALSRSSGLVRREGQTVVVELWLKGAFEPAQRKLFGKFLQTMSRAITTHFQGHCAPLAVRLLDGAPEL